MSDRPTILPRRTQDHAWDCCCDACEHIRDWADDRKSERDYDQGCAR